MHAIKEPRMRRLLGFSLSIALGVSAIAVLPVAAASDNGRNDLGDIEIVANTGPLAFGSAAEIKSYRVTIPKGSRGASRNGRLIVETQDGFCCQDFWGVRILKHNGKVMAEAVSDGSGVGNVEPDDAEWSGAASIRALPRKGVTVEVYYDSGSDTFPAQMWVRLRFSGEDIVVTPLP
jgi:hypothetical protein